MRRPCTVKPYPDDTRQSQTRRDTDTAHGMALCLFGTRARQAGRDTRPLARVARRQTARAFIWQINNLRSAPHHPPRPLHTGTDCELCVCPHTCVTRHRETVQLRHLSHRISVTSDPPSMPTQRARGHRHWPRGHWPHRHRPPPRRPTLKTQHETSHKRVNTITRHVTSVVTSDDSVV